MDFRHRDYYLVGRLYSSSSHYDAKRLKRYFPIKCKSKHYCYGKDKYTFLVSIPKWLSKNMQNYMADQNIRFKKVECDPIVNNYFNIVFRDIELERKINSEKMRIQYYEKELKL